MKVFSVSLFLLAAQMNTQIISPDDGNLIAEPHLADYSQGDRSPGIVSQPEEVQDIDGNPSSL